MCSNKTNTSVIWCFVRNKVIPQYTQNDGFHVVFKYVTYLMQIFLNSKIFVIVHCKIQTHLTYNQVR